jgi:hypothetical protein
MRPFAGDALRALIFANILGAAGCVLLAHLLALQAFRSRRAAAAAAFLTASSPLLWFYGSIGQAYVWEAFNALVFANLAWRAARRARAPRYRAAEHRRGRVGGTLVWAAAFSGALGFFGGLRPFDVAFFLPLWILVVLRARRRLAVAAVGVPLLGLGILTWLVPTALASGGWKAYVASCLKHGSRVGEVVWKTPVMVVANLSNMVLWSAAGLGAATLAALWVVGLRRRAIREAVGPWSGAGARWAAAIVPASAFYILGHLGQPGYVLTVVPLLIVILAGALDIALRPPPSAPSFALVVCGMAVANCAFFLAAAPLPVPMAGTRSLPSWLAPAARLANGSALNFTWGEIRDNDAFCRSWQSYVRAHFNPEDTVLVAETTPSRRIYDRLITYHLREYALLALNHSWHRHTWYRPGLVPRSGGPTVLVPQSARHLVWLVSDLPLWADAGARGIFTELAVFRARTRQMRVLELPAGSLPVSYLGFRLVQAEAVQKR